MFQAVSQIQLFKLTSRWLSLKNLYNSVLLSVPICFLCSCQNNHQFYALRKMASALGSKKHFTVFVEGNIGSGKTTFLEFFKNSENVTAYAEPVDKWRDIRGHNLLALMYENAPRWSLTFQTMVQKTMLEVHLDQPKTPIKIMERSIHSARYVFVDNLLQCGTMPPAEHAVLDSWYEFITSQLDVSGDLIIYLKTSPEVVYERIKQRSRPEENSISLSYVTSLHELHEKWLLNKTNALCKEKVIVIDANKPMNEMKEELLKCEELINTLSHASLHPNSLDVSDHKVITSPTSTILDVA